MEVFATDRRLSLSKKFTAEMGKQDHPTFSWLHSSPSLRFNKCSSILVGGWGTWGPQIESAAQTLGSFVLCVAAACVRGTVSFTSPFWGDKTGDCETAKRA